jgi:chaperonin GroEL (HSP60 family)
MINIEPSPIESSFLINIEGGIIPKGFSDMNYVAKSGKEKISFENPLILVANFTIEKPSQISYILEFAIEVKRPLVLFAESISDNCHKQLLFNVNRGILDCVGIDMSLFNDRALDYLEDCAVLFGAVLLDLGNRELLRDKVKVVDLFGTCKKMEIDVLACEFLTSEWKSKEHLQRIEQHVQKLIGIKLILCLLFYRFCVIFGMKKRYFFKKNIFINIFIFFMCYFKPDNKKDIIAYITIHK